MISINICHTRSISWLIIYTCVALIQVVALGQPETVTLNASDSLSRDIQRGQIFTLGDKSYLYQRPGTLDFVKHFPGNLLTYCRDTFQKKQIPNILAMTAVTALMVAYDQPMLDETQRFGRRIGLKGNNRLKRAFDVLGFPIELPYDTDTWLYFIGDGWTHSSVAAMFLGYGLVAGNNRALQTASQIAGGMLGTGLSTQFLKHITGRESPFVATVPGGRWRPFPNQVEYHKRVPHYDAFPSGHLATGMMTVTVIAENYPDSKIVKPIGYTLLALLSFQMVNNGVHWVSDYPLAVAMGYSMGKIAAGRGRQLLTPDPNDRSGTASRWSVIPYFHPRGVGAIARF